MGAASNKLAAAYIGLSATAMPLLVRLLPLRVLLRVLTPPRWWRPFAATQPGQIVQSVERRLAAPRMMRRRACLRKSLVLYHALRLAGRPAQLRFGLYGPEALSAAGEPWGGLLRGHCWVELDGRCLSEPPDAPATVIHGYPSGKMPVEAERGGKQYDVPR